MLVRPAERGRRGVELEDVWRARHDLDGRSVKRNQLYAGPAVTRSDVLATIAPPTVSLAMRSVGVSAAGVETPGNRSTAIRLGARGGSCAMSS
jgi:hypothetical protein